MPEDNPENLREPYAANSEVGTTDASDLILAAAAGDTVPECSSLQTWADVRKLKWDGQLL